MMRLSMVRITAERTGTLRLSKKQKAIFLILPFPTLDFMTSYCTKSTPMSKQDMEPIIAGRTGTKKQLRRPKAICPIQVFLVKSYTISYFMKGSLRIKQSMV